MRSVLGGRRPPRLGGLIGIGLILSVALAAPSVAARTQGEKIEVTGVVTDPEGRPLSDLRVSFEVARSYFSLRQLRTDARDTRRVSTVTNARGEYSLAWPWDDYFNTFHLVVGVPVRKGQEEKLEVLLREDVTQRVGKGTPVVAALVVQDARLVSRVREFVAGVESVDERRVYAEMGKPDEVKTVKYPDRDEVSWWYFERGRMYRFESGELRQVVHFDPVKAF